MQEPLVSVCIGTYNREQSIRGCLDSVFAQTYGNLDVVVADNASTDRTTEIVESYGPRIRLIRRETNSGMCSTTRNLAVRAARGTHVAFLDSDDAWLPGKLEQQIRFMRANPGFPLCHTYCRVVDADAAERGVRHEGRIPPSGPYFEALLDHCWITISSVLMEKRLFDECGPFTESLPYGRLGEDYEFFLKVARTYEIGFLPEILTVYRTSHDGISRGDWRGMPEAFPFLECLRHRKDIWDGIVPPAAMDAALWRSALSGSRHWRDRGHGLRAAYFPLKILRANPLHGAAWAELAKSLYRTVVPGKTKRG